LADDFVTDPSSGGGETFAADEIASVKYPRVKLIHGADGVNAGDVANGNPLPVVQTGTHNIGTVTAVTGITNALPAGTNNIGDVDVLTLPAATNAGATAKTSDYDTGAGTDTVTMMGLALPASGGAVQGGTATNPVRTDPTGTTTQPISGTVTANAGTGTLAVSLASVPSHAVTGPLTDAELRATAVPVSGPVTDAQIRATPVPVSGTVTANAGTGTFAVSGPLTDTELRATPVPVSGTVTANAGTGTFAVSGPLTDTQLRATAVPVSGTITANAGSGTLAVSLASVPSHAVTNAGTFATQVDGAALTALQLIDDVVFTDDTAFTPATSKVLVIGAEADETTPDSVDEGDAGALRMTLTRALHVNLRDAAGAEVAVGGGTQYTEDAAAAANPVGTVLNLIREDARAGSLTSNDGDNVAARGTNAGELYVKHVDSVPATQSGTWTVQPGNTANTTAWKVDGSAVTQPVSGTVTANAGTGTFTVSGTVTANAGTGTLAVSGPLTDTQLRATAVPVSLASVPSHAVTNAGTFATQVDGAALTALQLIDNPVIVDDAAFTPATSSVMMAGFEADETATDSVDEGDAGAARMTLDRKQIVATYAHTAGGWTPSKTVSAASTNATSLKASAGQVGYVFASNVNAAVRYLKFYNKASAPTVGTDTPVMTLAIPGNTAGAGFALAVGSGVEFTTGIAWALTTEATDAGTTGVAANELVVNIGYK